MTLEKAERTGWGWRMGLATVATVLWAVGAPLTAQTGIEGLADEIAGMVSDWNVPGLAVAIIENDEITFAEGFGVRTLGGSDPVDEHTIFAVGSTSKAFTATAIGMLADEGLLGLDDPVLDHLPDFRLSDPYVTRAMRVRDLMSHNSGLLRGDRIWYASGRNREEVLHQARYQPLTHPLRATFEYNNITWIAAGEVIEERSGMSWDRFLEERIFTPLGMSRANTSVVPLSKMDNVATPHIELPDGQLKAVPYRNIDNAGPAGSINASAVDMAQWVRLHLGGGEYEGTRLVSEEQIRESHTGQMIMRTEGSWGLIFPESDFLTYGLGWFLSEYRGLKLVSHGGNIDGMTAFVGFVPERNYGFVLLANQNSTNAFMSALAHRLIDRFEGGEGEDWSTRMQKVWDGVVKQAQEQQQKTEDSRIEGTSPSLPLAEYEGVYESAMYGEISVTRDGDGLAARFGDGFHGPLEHWHYDTFRAVWDDPSESKEFFRFELGTDGAVQVLHAEIEGPQEFEKRSEEEPEAGHD